jgi:5-(carboxyamino)imidazole ribonucleotide mutase
MNTASPLVSVVMGSRSDWDTMSEASIVLGHFGIPHECQVVSAHRTPAWMCEFAETAAGRGIQVIIAGAGGAAHLPGMIASMTHLPVLGVPVQSKSLNGLQMPGGIPVGTLAIGQAGAKNAGLLAVRILALRDTSLSDKLKGWMQDQTDAVLRDRSLTLNPPQPS